MVDSYLIIKHGWFWTILDNKENKLKYAESIALKLMKLEVIKGKEIEKSFIFFF